MATLNSSWIKRKINDVLEKTFAVSHVKSTYYNYSENKTLDDVLIETEDFNQEAVTEAEISPVILSKINSVASQQSADFTLLNANKAEAAEVYTKAEIDNKLLTPEEHSAASVTDENGTHGIRYNSGKIQVNNNGSWEDASALTDDALSETSENPVQNKVIKNFIDKTIGDTDISSVGDGSITSAINFLNHNKLGNKVLGSNYVMDCNDFDRPGIYNVSDSTDPVFLTGLENYNTGDFRILNLYEGDPRYSVLLLSSPRMNKRMFVGSFWDRRFLGWEALMTSEMVSNPNLLINPDFRINQRQGKIALAGKTAYTDPECTNVTGTTGRATAIIELTSTYAKYIGDDGNFYYVKSEDVVDGYINSAGKYSFDRWFMPYTTIVCYDKTEKALKIHSGVNEGIQQYIENYKNLEDKVVTLSVCYKSEQSGSPLALCQIKDGKFQFISYVNLPLSSEYTIAKLTAKVGTNIDKLLVAFTCGDWDVYIKWMKLEEGSVATSFVSPEPATELLKCQRYFERYYRKIANYIVCGVGTNYVYGGIDYIEKRIAPSTTWIEVPRLVLHEKADSNPNIPDKHALSVQFYNTSERRCMLICDIEDICKNNNNYSWSGVFLDEFVVYLDAEIY